MPLLCTFVLRYSSEGWHRGALARRRDEQNLVKPIIVTASKSRVRLRYPVTYSHMTFVSDTPLPSPLPAAANLPV